MAQWINALELRRTLAAEGWKSPDTYDRYFAEAGNFPAVYLFLLTEKETFERGIVAYVGMSRRVLSRWNTHTIFPALESDKHWPQRWFLPLGVDRLRAVESALIHRFDPPWNINGRKRGVVLQ